MPAAEQYLKPEVIRQIKRLDLRAQFIVKGFLQGLHASPFHGFSVEFSEHRKYTAGDDPKDIDWLIYAKTDKYYVKKFEAETNITGYLVMDLSRSMGYTYRQELTKFEYSICLAAALVLPDDPPAGPGGPDHLRREDPQQPAAQDPPSAPGRHAFAVVESQARRRDRHRPEPAQIAAMLRHASLVMIFSDLLAEPAPVLEALYRLRHGGHDVILFHVLDEAEVEFPFRGMVELEDPESHRPPAARRRRLPPRLPGRGRGLPRPVPPRVPPGPASTTCRWIRACSSTALDGVPGQSGLRGDRGDEG